MRYPLFSTWSRIFAAIAAYGQLQITLALPNPQNSGPPDPTAPNVGRAQSFEWSVLGDSWSSGVAYSTSTVYSKTDLEFCYRTNEAWGAQMEADPSWTEGPQRFHFAACGGTLMNDINRQLGRAGTPQLIMGTFGGNNAKFGDIARACIYQPAGTLWGPAFDEDPNGVGACKIALASSQDYMRRTLRRDTTDLLKDVFKFAQSPQQSLPTFGLYVSSYVPFFNADTDECSGWSFAPWFSWNKPKLVKELRKVMNDMVETFNSIQADVVANYQAPDLINYHVKHIPISGEFEGHRFCEPGHSFNDQYTSKDVWIWNLQWNNGEQGLDIPGVVKKTDKGVLYMDKPAGNEDVVYMEAVLSLDATEHLTLGDALVTYPHTPPKVDIQRQSGFGWTARPFHPKQVGHEAIKNAFIRRLRSDHVVGVKQLKLEVVPIPRTV